MNPLTCPTEPADRDRAIELLKALGGTGEALVLTVPGNPISKPRPRAGQGRVRSSERQKAAERALGLALGTEIRKPLEGNLALVAIFYRDSRDVVDRDNLDKLVGDAAKGIVYADDCQVTGGAQLVELDRDNPRTVLAIASHESSLTR